MLYFFIFFVYFCILLSLFSHVTLGTLTLLISMAFAFILSDYMNLFYFFPSDFCPLSLCVLANRCTMKTFIGICKSRIGFF